MIEEIYNQLIPGFSLLSVKQQRFFLDSEAGLKCKNAVEQIAYEVNQFQEKLHWWSLFSSQAHSNKAFVDAKCKQIILQTLQNIKDDKDYEQLRSRIIILILRKNFPEIKQLKENEVMELSKTTYSKKIYKQLFLKSSETNQLLFNSESVLDQWYQSFKKDRNFANFHWRLSRLEGLKRLNFWFSILPALIDYDDKNSGFPTQDFLRHYHRIRRKTNPDYQTLEISFLSYFVYFHLQKACESNLEQLNLHEFNFEQAQKLSRLIYENATDKKELNYSKWKTNYEKLLIDTIIKNLLAIDTHNLPVVDSPGVVTQSLSSLFQQNKTLKKTSVFINKLADAHAFLQFTGMATQNDSAVLSLFDVYNYKRSANNVSEAKKILNSILQPLMPLYYELREVAFYEKNLHRKVFRILFPLFIIAAVMVIAGALLSPLLIPELAFIIAAIPLLYFGMFIASRMVLLKNELHNSLRIRYYGSQYAIPEFQLNERLIFVFKRIKQAEHVRQLYLNALKNCDKIEDEFAQIADSGVLTATQMNSRKQNINFRLQLQLEWYDIHSNVDLGSDQALLIAQKRVQYWLQERIQRLNETLQEKDIGLLSQKVKQVTQKATTPLLLPNSLEELLVVTEEPSQNTNMKATDLVFFSLRSLPIHRQAKQMNTLLDDINTSLQTLS